MKTRIVIIATFILCLSVYANKNDEMYALWYKRGVERVGWENYNTARNCFQIALSYKPNDAEVRQAIVEINKRLDEERATEPHIDTPWRIAESTDESQEVKQRKLQDHVLLMA